MKLLFLVLDNKFKNEALEIGSIVSNCSYISACDEPENLGSFLNLINEKIKTLKLKGRIRQIRNQYYFVATFPLLDAPKNELGKPKKKQQYILVGSTKANPQQYQTMERQVLELAEQVTNQTFRWPQEKDPDKIPEVITVKKFKTYCEILFADLYRGKDKGRATRAWNSKWSPALNKLPSSDNSGVSLASIKQLILEFPAQSAVRRDQGSILIRVAAKIGWDASCLQPLIKGYGAKMLTPRDVPSDEEIEMYFNKIKLPHWQFTFAACAIFGLRPHEVANFTFRPEHGWIDIGEETKTGGRVVKAIPLKWIEKFGLMDLPRPKTDPYQIAKAAGDALDRDGVKLRLYDLRHAFAIRCFTLGITADHGAALMGHTLAVHENTYRKWITKDRVMKALDKLDDTIFG